MAKNNDIYIIGAGAIGKVLATFLKKAGRNVTILRGSVDDQPSHFENITVELSDKTKIKTELKVSTFSNFTKLDGLIVLTNKSFGNQRLSKILKSKTNSSPIVILQNGLSVEQSFIDNNFPHIYRCVLFATSQPIAKNVFKFKPVSVSPIGTIQGNTESLIEIVRQLNSSNFQFKAEIEIRQIIWTKTIVNSIFNSVCPLLEIDNGIFHRNETALTIAKKIISQCVFIAQTKGVSLNIENVIDSLLLISRLSDGQLISTYQDIKSKRRTEIDTLNFAIVNVAKELDKENELKETLLLGELIKLKSELNQ